LQKDFGLRIIHKWVETINFYRWTKSILLITCVLMLSMNVNALSLPSDFAVNCLAKQHTPHRMPFMHPTRTGNISSGTISPPVLNVWERPVNMKGKESKCKASSQQKGQLG
jgi:hypothetical protein